MIVVVPVAFVRTTDGVVSLVQGDTVPSRADQDHVEHLTRAGVLAKPKGRQQAPEDKVD